MESLYTDEELATEIALFKAAIRDVGLGKSITINGETKLTEDLPQLRAHLQWLHSQKSEHRGFRSSSMIPARPV